MLDRAEYCMPIRTFLLSNQMCPKEMEIAKMQSCGEAALASALRQDFVQCEPPPLQITHPLSLQHCLVFSTTQWSPSQHAVWSTTGDVTFSQMDSSVLDLWPLHTRNTNNTDTLYHLLKDASSTSSSLNSPSLSCLVLRGWEERI